MSKLPVSPKTFLTIKILAIILIATVGGVTILSLSGLIHTVPSSFTITQVTPDPTLSPGMNSSVTFQLKNQVSQDHTISCNFLTNQTAIQFLSPTTWPQSYTLHQFATLNVTVSFQVLPVATGTIPWRFECRGL
jgi:hypothetical protein